MVAGLGPDFAVAGLQPEQCFIEVCCAGRGGGQSCKRQPADGLTGCQRRRVASMRGLKEFLLISLLVACRQTAATYGGRKGIMAANGPGSQLWGSSITRRRQTFSGSGKWCLQHEALRDEGCSLLMKGCLLDVASLGPSGRPDLALFEGKVGALTANWENECKFDGCWVWHEDRSWRLPLEWSHSGMIEGEWLSLFRCCVAVLESLISHAGVGGIASEDSCMLREMEAG